MTAAATKEVKHTPGPWRIADRDGDSDYSIDNIMADNRRIANVYGGTTDEPYASNARLIAAAPDLLDGCNALLGHLQLLAARDDLTPALQFALTHSHRIDEALAAIAKATT